PGQPVAVQRLLRLAGPDADHLRQVQLIAVAGAVEESVAGGEDRRMHDELAAGRRAGDERAGARGLQAGERVASVAGRLDVGIDLGADAGEAGGVQHVVEDEGAVAVEDGGDFGGRRVGGQVLEAGHAGSFAPAAGGRQPFAAYSAAAFVGTASSPNTRAKIVSTWAKDQAGSNSSANSASARWGRISGSAFSTSMNWPP